MKAPYIKILIVLQLLLVFNSTMAQQVSESEAKVKAMNFFSNGANRLPARKGVKRKAPAVSNVELAYTSKKDGKTCFYVYNNGTDGGFVIVGGDEVAQEILAYVPQGHFDYDKAPDNVKWWLGQYEQEISSAKKFTAQRQQKSAPRRVTSTAHDLFSDIPDLITTKWDQGEPYNAAIPEIHHTDGNSVVPPTGCVPTAIAQIMNYWKWPITGEGSNSYTLYYDRLDEEGAGANLGDFEGLLPATFSADFGSTTYDWDNMLDDYTIGAPTQAQIDAVSILMYHFGVSEHTLYGPSGSGGGAGITKALKDNFKYSNRLTYLGRGDYLDDEWEEIVYSELSAGRPVFYESGLHAFILHGYSKDINMFSVNWGWGGFMDGYYQIIGTNSGYFVNDENYVQDYASHGIIIHIEPNTVVCSNTFSEVGDTITIDGIRYDLIGPLSKTVEVTYAPNDEVIYMGELTIPETIDYNNETYTVTKIGRYGLASSHADFNEVMIGGTTELTSLHLPNTLRGIAQGGLRGSNIQNLFLPESVQMLGEQSLSAMHELTRVKFPSQLTYVPTHCFLSCQKLEYVSLPASIQYIGVMCFAGCPNLDILEVNSLDVPEVCLDAISPNNPFITVDTERGVLAVPRSSVDLYRNDLIFQTWKNIIPLDSLPSNIAERFEESNVIYKIQIDGTVGVVGYSGDGENEDLIIPSIVSHKDTNYMVKQISARAFWLKQFQSVIVEDGVTKIGETAFANNTKLKYISLPKTLEIIDNDAFDNCVLLSEICIPSSVRYIGYGAFSNCSALTSIYIPNSVTTLGNAFASGCTRVRQVKLPSSLAVIPQLSSLPSLKSIVLPASSSAISIAAFSQLHSLNTMLCYASSVPQLTSINDSPTFSSNISNGTLYVPAESVEEYKATPGWQEWGTILPIVPIETMQLENLALAKSRTTALDIRTLPTNATDGQIFYSSSNPKVATISHDGKITAHEVGKAVITAETMDGKIATCTVTVKAGTVGTLVDAIDGLPSGRTTLKDVDDAVDSILER